jgi:esterase/lipase superfamily enzyme
MSKIYRARRLIVSTSPAGNVVIGIAWGFLTFLSACSSAETPPADSAAAGAVAPYLPGVLQELQPPPEAAAESALAQLDTAEYEAIDVHFGTNRRPTGRLDPNEFFGSQRGPQLNLGIVRVSIPKNIHRPGELERPYRFVGFVRKEDPRKHVTLLALTPLSASEWKASLADSTLPSGQDQILVYVHGYNNDFAAAARKAAQLSYDLGMSYGSTAMFSWPSQATLQGYPADEAASEAAIPLLSRFLITLRDGRPSAKISLIAHSMGARVVGAVLRQFAALPDGPRFDQVIFAAADIDAEVFRDQVVPAIRNVGSRVTLYASDNDAALRLSKRFHAFRRAGQAGDSIVILDGLDTVDASTVDTDRLGHGYFAENKQVIDDLFMLLRRALPPGDRNLRPRGQAPRAYWVLP